MRTLALLSALILSGCGFLSSFKPAPQEPAPPDNSRVELLMDATFAIADENEDIYCSGAVIERAFVTAYHCVESGKPIKVQYLGEWFEAVPYFSYKEVDLALVQPIGAKPRASLVLSTWDSIIGQKVAWAGHPLGEHKRFFLGNVAALEDPEFPFLIDIDGQFIPGNSGGPVIDESGGVIGVVSSTSVFFLFAPQIVPIGHAVKAQYIRELLDNS